jgi:hypothetical protein
MPTRNYLCLVLLYGTPLLSQVGVTPFEMPTALADEARMLIPPPISWEAYPTTVGSETRSNYVTTGLTVNTSYNDNVLLGENTTPVGDVVYSILPTIALDQATPRQHSTLTYSPGFTFYQHTSALNAANQYGALDFQYRLSKHVTMRLSDTFQKSSNVFDQLYPASGGAIAGSTQATPIEVVAPYADRLNNVANVGLSYQFSRNAMIGAAGIVTDSNYSNPAQASGLNNSNSYGGSVFYSLRLSTTQYIGLTYQYLRSQGNPANAQANPANGNTEIQTHALFPFYTIYFGPMFSLSLSIGPQYFDAAESGFPPFRSWTPTAKASIGWQRSHTNLAASYSRIVPGSIGLPGAFNSATVSGLVQWQMTRTWIVGSTANYSNNGNLTPNIPSSGSGGYTVSGTVLVQRSMGDHIKAELGYARLHQSYSGISVISNAPNSNREFISITYQFARPLGR